MERKSLIQLSAVGGRLRALGSWVLATELEFSGCLTLADGLAELSRSGALSKSRRLRLRTRQKR